MSQGDGAGASAGPSSGSGGALPFILATPIHTSLTTSSTRHLSSSPPRSSPAPSTSQLSSDLASTSLEMSPFSLLPEELVEQILLVAAHRHPGAALSLALTSHSVCSLTAKARWRSVILTRAGSVAALWRLLVSHDARAQLAEAAGTEYAREARLYLDQDLGWSPGSAISIPENPGSCVRHLFLQLPHVRVLELSDALLAASSQRAEAAASALAARGAPFNLVQQVKLAPTRAWARPEGLLELLPSLEVLDLGAAETQLLRPSLLRATPRELTLSYDGDDSIFGTITWVSHATSLRGSTRRSTDAFASAKLRTQPHFDGLRSRLERLHIVAVDPRAEVAGIPFTVGLFEPLRRGSVRQGSLIHTLAAAAKGAKLQRKTGDAAWWDCEGETSAEEKEERETFSSGLTHLRYDTRRFSFKPPEIFAARLRPFFMELSAAAPVQRAPATQYVHTGARHAAPPRGAGAAQSSSGSSSAPLPLDCTSDSTESMLLGEWGVGGLQRLHFAWEPGTSLSSSSSSAAPAPAGADSGGWPSERRGAWTDRSGRAPTFATEMIESIQALYGWRSPEPHGEYTDKMRAGWSDADREVLGDTQAALERAREAVRPEAPPDATQRRSVVPGKEKEEAEGAKVKYTVRPPGSVLKLGGIAAFDPARRLALFLDRVRGGQGAWT